MKSKFASLFLLFVAACYNTVTPSESETSDTDDAFSAACPDTDSAETGDSASALCSVPVSVADCTVTYPECDSSLPEVRFLTHGSHDCEVPYPPKFCQYVGDVTCNGIIAGVWCCK